MAMHARLFIFTGSFLTRLSFVCRLILLQISYLVMFAYISLTLGDTPRLSSFYFSSKVSHSWFFFTETISYFEVFLLVPPFVLFFWVCILEPLPSSLSFSVEGFYTLMKLIWSSGPEFRSKLFLCCSILKVSVYLCFVHSLWACAWWGVPVNKTILGLSHNSLSV